MAELRSTKSIKPKTFFHSKPLARVLYVLATSQTHHQTYSL